jgi:hypothetical protein
MEGIVSNSLLAPVQQKIKIQKINLTRGTQISGN